MEKKFRELQVDYLSLDKKQQAHAIGYIFGVLEGHFDVDGNETISRAELVKWVNGAIVKQRDKADN